MVKFGAVVKLLLLLSSIATVDSIFAAKAAAQCSIYRNDLALNQLMLIHADDMSRHQNDLTLQGHAQIRTPSLGMQGSLIHYNRLNQTLSSPKPFYFEQEDKRFWAQSMRQQSPTHSFIDDVEYSSCLGSREDLHWSVRASHSELNDDENYLILHHARLYVAGIPVLYTPWVNLPLYRRSGLLPPTVGVYRMHKEQGRRYGWLWVQPGYVNLASHIDYTYTLSWMESRSLHNAHELRWLNRFGQQQLEIDHMRKDDLSTILYPDNQQDLRRFRLRGSQNINPIAIQYDWLSLSYRDYFQQLPPTIFKNPMSGSFTRFVQASSSWKQRPVDLKHSWKIRVSENYSLNNADADSYLQIPSINYNLSKTVEPSWINFQTDFSFTNFQTPADRELRNYRTSVLRPSVNVANLGLPWFVSSFEWLGFATHHQRLDQTIGDEDLPAENSDLYTYHAKVTLSKLMSSLRFQNVSTFIKPSMQYLYAPMLTFTDGHPSSVFRALDINHYSALSSPYRFNENDFAGPSNRLVARLQYLLSHRDWQTQLTVARNYDVNEEHNQSPVAEVPMSNTYQDTFANLSHQHGKSRYYSNLQWTKDGELRQSGVEWLYSPSLWSVWRFASARQYRIEDEQFKQPNSSQYLSVGVSQQVTNEWRGVFQINHQTPQKRYYSRQAGLRYESCCWISNLLYEQRLNSLEQDDVKESLVFSVQLKSLGQFGTLANPLEDYYKRASGEDR